MSDFKPIKLSKRRKEVIKHSSAVQITNSISLLQRRAWNILLAKAFDDLASTERYQIRVRELVEMLDYNSNDDSHLKEALEKLTTTAVKWNILGKDKTCEWGSFPLLAGAVIRQGILTYAFSPFLKEKLHNPRMYAKISLSLQNKFQSKHALALYELCFDYFDVEKNYGETPYIPVAEFRELMGVDETEYPSFARLNEKVIKKAVTEINDVSDLTVSVKMQRFNRKIDEIKFCIFRKIELSLPFRANDVELHEKISPISSEYDDIFFKLPSYKQKEIMNQAYSMLPDFAKQYQDGEPKVTDSLIKPLLEQKRNDILKKLFT